MKKFILTKFEKTHKKNEKTKDSISEMSGILKGVVNLCGIGLWWFVVAFLRFNDESVAYGFGGDFDANDFTIDESADFLDVWFEFSFGFAGNFSPYTTEVFCFTASGDASSGTGSFSGEITFSGHKSTPGCTKTIYSRGRGQECKEFLEKKWERGKFV